MKEHQGDRKMKMFITGMHLPEPGEHWDPGPRSIVVAYSAEEVCKMTDSLDAVEICADMFTSPIILMSKY